MPIGMTHTMPIGLVVGFDEHQAARVHRRVVAFGQVGAGVGPGRLGVAELQAVDDVRLLDHAVDGRVPAVVVRAAQERLEHVAVHEAVDVLAAVQHVGQRVRLALEPELVRPLHAARDREHVAVVGRHDHRRIVRTRDRPRLRLDRAVEEIVVRLPAPVRVGFVGDELVQLHVLVRERRQPTVRAMVERVPALRRVQVAAPLLEDLPDRLVERRVAEDRLAGVGHHHVREQGRHRKRDAVRVVVRRHARDLVERDQQLLDALRRRRERRGCRILARASRSRTSAPSGRDRSAAPAP